MELFQRSLQVAFQDEEAAMAGRARETAAGAATLALAFVLAAPAGEAAEDNGRARHVWLDAAGEPLPFQDPVDIEEFLRDARVASRERIGVGINKMDKLLVENDGVRAHAIFRTVDESHDRMRMGDRLYMRFEDSWANECAAYAVARLFGVEVVPPTVKRHLDGQQGSMQLWVEKARDPAAKDFRPPSAIAWVQQTWGMHLFDNLVFNADRNAGNVLAGQDYRIWLIDHTRAFQPRAELLSPEDLQRVRRRAWTRLLETGSEDLADATREFLDPDQVTALAARRELLVKHFQALIAERGEDTVLY